MTGVLNSVSQALSSNLDAFWGAYVRHDTNADCHIDISEVSHFFKDLFQVGRGGRGGREDSGITVLQGSQTQLRLQLQ